jgi:octaprenyl-diphosphate synthase
VKEVIAFVRESGGLEYAEKSMYEYQAKAIEILSTTPDSEAKTSLQALIKYVIDRKK